MVVPTLTSDKPTAHEYKKRPAAIRAMTDEQIDKYELLARIRNAQYALYLEQQYRKRLHEEIRFILRATDPEIYNPY